MRLFFSDKSIVLFELLDRWWKREASKSRDHIIMKGKQAAQEKISITFAITNNLGPWDFRRQASNIAWRPTPDPKANPTPLKTHPTQPS